MKNPQANSLEESKHICISLQSCSFMFKVQKKSDDARPHVRSHLALFFPTAAGSSEIRPSDRGSGRGTLSSVRPLQPIFLRARALTAEHILQAGPV